MKSITLRFEGIKIKIDREGMDFTKLEEIVYEVSHHIGREVLKKAVEDMDDELMKERFRGELENCGKKGKYLGTRLGDIRYKRRAYKEKGKKGYRYLVDEELGIKKNQRITTSREKLESFVGFMSKGYRTAEEMLEKLTGSSRSFESIRQGAIREGEKIKKHEEGQIERIKNLEEVYEGERQEVVYVETDGTMVSLQRKKKSQRRKKRKIEVKVGIGYTGWESRYKGGKKKQKKLQKKFIYGGIERGRDFMEKLSLVGEKELGISQAKETVVGGDGARWIKDNIEGYFGKEAIYHLSDYHLNREIKWGLGYNKEKEWEVKSLVSRHKIKEAIKEIEKEIGNNRGNRKRLRQLEYYLVNNQEGIGGIRRLKAKKIRRDIHKTGAIETQMDKVIAHRFKKRGMGWSERGIEGLLKVGIRILNGRWDEWWEKEREEKIEIRKEDITRLIPKNIWQKRRVGRVQEVHIPCLRGPHQDRPWVEVMRAITGVNQHEGVDFQEFEEKKAS